MANPTLSPFLADFPNPPAGIGVPDVDDDTLTPEQFITLPWAISNPEATWLDYRCFVEVNLDAGMALHKPLPQKAATPDTLASGFIDDKNLDANTLGVNLVSGAQAVDVIQRMATSTYTFILRGYGLRAGYQIPIPGLRSVGGQPAVPAEVQRAANVIVGNASGVPIYFAYWHLEYYVSGPFKPSSPGLAGQPGSVMAPVPPNLAAHITGQAQLPASIKLPFTQTDQNSAPPGNLRGPLPQPPVGPFRGVIQGPVLRGPAGR